MNLSLPAKPFGLEPAATGAALTAALPMLVFVHWVHVSDKQLGLLGVGVAAVTAAYVAFTTQHGTLAVVLGVLQSGLALATGFGAGISTQQQATAMASAGVILGLFFNRQVTTPLAKVRAAAETGVLYGQTALGAPLTMTVSNPGGILADHQASNVQVRDAKGHFAKKGTTPPEHQMS